LLGLLAMDPGTVVRRDGVVDVLWGQDAPHNAVNLVQTQVSRLRKLLAPQGKDIITFAGAGYRLQIRSEQLDLLTFRALAANARAARANGDDLAACDLYEQALRLWRGDPLADLDVLADQPGVAEQRRELADVLLRYAEIACGFGFHDRVLPRLRSLAAAEPLNEPVHARLMMTLAGTGQQAAAVRVYEDIRFRLDREFGVYPSDELAEAHLRVLRQDIPVAKCSFSQRPTGHVVPRQLPAAARYFTGRDGERALLSDLLARVSPEAGGMVIAGLTGMAGIGKTALAVSWAHQVADRFPDGQLFVDLRGFCPAGSPLEATEALHGFLTALGIPTGRIPEDIAECAALYRSTLASRRVLIVLDNARDAEQVRPLLPGSPGCMVLVTSRHRLTGLAAGEGAHLIPLGGLAEGEARSLLARLLSARQVVADPGAIGELIALCARLPLALCNAAARAAARPELSVATVVAEMEDERARLDALETGEVSTSVRVLFAQSHARLSDLASETFQMLGMHPGPEITVPAAASLARLDRTRAQAAISELCDEHLLTEHAPGRYACHELLRAYAAEAARTHVSESRRRAAVYRMLDHYLHTAAVVSATLFPYLIQRTLDRPRPGVLPERVGDVRQAARWAEAERSVLLAVIGLAAEGGYFPHVWELPWAAGWFLNGEECWRQLADAQEVAAEIASRLGDPGGAALAHHHLGWLRFRLEEDAAARDHLDRCPR
jgi:DNA-binding SARP family transcriptional activator